MITTINNTLQNLLIDTENTQIKLSEASKKMNEVTPASGCGRSFHTVGEMERGKFRKMFDRHHAAFRLFN